MKKYKSKIFRVIHQEAEAMYEIGAITLKEMREFDEMCLVTPVFVFMFQNPLISLPSSQTTSYVGFLTGLDLWECGG